MGGLRLILLARVGSAEPTVSHTPNRSSPHCCLLCVPLYASFLSTQPRTSPLPPKPFYCVPWSGSVANKLFSISTSSQNLSPSSRFRAWLNSEDTVLPYCSSTLYENVQCFDNMRCPSLSLPNAHLHLCTEQVAIIRVSSVSHPAS